MKKEIKKSFKKVIGFLVLLSDLSFVGTVQASVSGEFKGQTAVPIPNIDGENYLTNVQKSIVGLTHNNILSIFSTASLVPVTADSRQAVVCLQNIPKGIYRAHSHNPNASGIVTSASDLAAFSPMFSLNVTNKFLLNVNQNINGEQKIITYIAQIIAKHGDGTADGDTICYARYLQIGANDSKVNSVTVSSPSSSGS